MTTIRRRIKASQAQEARGAAAHGGRVRPGSGSKSNAKGDVKVPQSEDGFWPEGVLIEYKRTDGKGISVTSVILEKIRREALSEGRRMLLGLQIGGRNYIVLEEGDYFDLKEAADGR